MSQNSSWALCSVRIFHSALCKTEFTFKRALSRFVNFLFCGIPVKLSGLQPYPQLARIGGELPD